MKPFNLQEALAGKPVVTRNGRAVNKIVYFPEAMKYPVIAYSGAIEVSTYTEEGKFYAFKEEKSDRDLFMASTKKTGWLNVYRGNIIEYFGRTALKVPNGQFIHASKEVADQQQNTAKERIAVVELTWEE